MNKKTVSQGVKDFCKTFAIIYGVGIWLNITAHLLAYFGSVLNLGDWFDKLVNWLMFPYVLVFGLLSFYIVAPIMVVSALIICGAVFAISEKNSKNIFNLPLLGTIGLVVINTVMLLLIPGILG